MEDVSDPPFRYVCKHNGADLMYSEFISSEGLIRDAMKSRMKLDFFEYERPFGIQIFGGDEEAMAMSARIVDTVQPDLVDINFGCPVNKVVSKNGGSALLRDCPKRSQAWYSGTKYAPNPAAQTHIFPVETADCARASCPASETIGNIPKRLAI